MESICEYWTTLNDFWIVWVFVAKSKKRPARASKKGTPGEEGSPASKKPRVHVSCGRGRRRLKNKHPNTDRCEEGPQGITEEALRRYLTRKPMTSKDLLQKFKSKRTGLSNDGTVKSLLLLLERYNPSRRPSKGNYICRLNHRAEMYAREGLLFRPSSLNLHVRAWLSRFNNRSFYLGLCVNPFLV